MTRGHHGPAVLIEPGSFATGIWAGARYPEQADAGDYAAAYRHARTATGRLARFMPHPRWVARTVRLALASRVPLARYLLGLDAVGGVLAERLTPTAVSDRVKEAMAGIR